ncbi:hypothetical protein L1987_58587 [Smallanthus sonchifolius]|uniref:Uncharacterized protein n=1 Tax=Smallanthus sonchifolius TaxID=185202 RepID=A0ACB9DGH7_9ASTR|nr:hypothetical protein L1987_58587 [Smallanthus sonchifolius]
MDPFLKKFFPSVYKKQVANTSTNQYCKFDSQILTMFTSSLYACGIDGDQETRPKLSMFFGGILFSVGALVNGFAQAVWMLILGRILLGLGIGFANQQAVTESGALNKNLHGSKKDNSRNRYEPNQNWITLPSFI